MYEKNDLTVGLEVEAFDDPQGVQNIEGAGEISADAAPDLVELIGLPAEDGRTAVQHVRTLADNLTDEAKFHHVRPVSRMMGSHIWRIDSRYCALRNAVSQECPQTGHGVNVMTNRAATHVNLGVDWETPAGVALITVVNNLAPHLSTALHTEHGIDCVGLLQPWQGWARKERFSSPDRWWTTPDELRLFYEKVPRLIRAGSQGEPEAVPDLSLWSGCMEDKFHLGTMWHFVRPKCAPDGKRYCELRVLASINPQTEAFYSIVEMLVALSRAIVVAGGDGITREEAPDLFSDLRQAGFAHYVPERPLNMDDWDSYPVWGQVAEEFVAA